MKTTDQTGQTRQTDPKSCTEECTEDKDAMNQVGRKNKRTPRRGEREVVISPLTVAAYDALLGEAGVAALEAAQTASAQGPAAAAARLMRQLRSRPAAAGMVPGILPGRLPRSLSRPLSRPLPGSLSGPLSGSLSGALPGGMVLSPRARRAQAKAVAGMLAGSLAVCFLPLAVPGRAQAPIAAAAARSAKSAAKPAVPGDPAASSLESYLTRVRADNKSVQAEPGAIWTDAGRLTRMSTDVRAMRPHDLISVVVSESLAASTDGTVKNSRASNASSSLTGLMGNLHASNALQNLVNQTSASGLNAQGTSATNSSLTTTFGGQVVEVLPNGMLVIEAARQVEFSQQTQTIVLRGLVRPEDISQQNQVLSTAISSMELQVRGKGIVNDFTHRQNALVRFLQWALVF